MRVSRSEAEIAKAFCFDDPDRMIWVQPTFWSRRCIFGQGASQ